MIQQNLLKIVCCGLLFASFRAEAFSPDTSVSEGALPRPIQSIDQNIEPQPACNFSNLIGSMVSKLDKSQLYGRPLRIIHEGDPVTQDFSPDRINIILDRGDRIIDVTCG